MVPAGEWFVRFLTSVPDLHSYEFVVKNLAFIAVLLLSGLPLYADFQDGLAAYNSGDYSTAAQEWQPIAERGDANAEYNMGLLYSSGQGVPRDYQMAAEWYEKAAEQGVAAAQYNLAVMYANGDGVPKSNRDAALWFEKAADNGIVAAAAHLGDIYYDGVDGVPDYAQAEKWYREAAEKGVPNAEFGLGLMYDLGKGFAQDFQQAIAWYTKAAEISYAPAMTNLGILYYNAQGEKRDLVQAYAWLGRAWKAGDPRALELLQTTGERMAPKDLRRAQSLMNEWQPASKPAPEVPSSDGLFKQPQVTPAGPSTGSTL